MKTRVFVTATAEFDLDIEPGDAYIYDAAADNAICSGLLEIRSVDILEDNK